MASRGTKLDDVMPKQDALLHLLGNRAFTAAGLAIHGVNTENVLTANITTYVINGIFYAKAATAEVDISAATFLNEEGDTVAIATIADDTKAYLLFVLDTSGNIRVVQGAAVGLTATPVWPKVPENYAAMGAVLVQNETGSAFTPGTTALDTANVTDTYYDLSASPAQTSP